MRVRRLRVPLWGAVTHSVGVPEVGTGQVQDALDDSVQLDSLWRVHDILVTWIHHAEAKAGLVMASSAAVLSLHVRLVSEQKDAPPLAVLLWGLTCVVLIGAFCVASACLIPIQRPRGWGFGKGTSLIYFHDVVDTFKGDRDRFVDEILASSRDRDCMALDVSRQLWNLSHVAAQKMQRANCSLACLALGVLGLCFLLGYDQL